MAIRRPSARASVRSISVGGWSERGPLTDGAIALVEAQGYAASALLSAADLYRALGRDEAPARALAVVAAVDGAPEGFRVEGATP